MKNIRRALLSALLVLLAAALVPTVAAAEEIEQVDEPDFVYPLRDAAYYAEHFPGVKMGSLSDSAPVDLSEAPEEIAPPGVKPLECHGDGYYKQELMISIIAGLPDEVVLDIMAPLGNDVVLLGITGNMQIGLGLCIRLSEDASIYDAAEILRADERVTDVARSSYIKAIDIPPSPKDPIEDTSPETDGGAATDDDPMSSEVKIFAVSAKDGGASSEASLPASEVPALAPTGDAAGHAACACALAAAAAAFAVVFARIRARRGR